MTQKKTLIFWVGLIITVLSLLFLFQFLWMVYVVKAITHPEFITGMVPAIVGAIIFVVIGIWMMLSE